MPQTPIEQTFDLACQHHQAGRLAEAEQLYRQVLAQQPELVDALHNLGVLSHQLGRIDLAVNLIRRAISLGPSCPVAHNNLGNALKSKGQLDEAIDAYRQSIVLKPDYAEAYNNLGYALQGKGQLDEAIAAYRQAIALDPRLAEVHHNLGIALKNRGQLEEAIIAYRQAVALDSKLAQAYNNLGNALQEIGELDQAIAALGRAVALIPGYADAHSNLGNALKDAGQLDEGIAAYRQAIALRPSLSEAHSNLIFTLQFHPACDARTIADENWLWNRRYALPLRKFIPTPPAGSVRAYSNDASPDRRLRVGYVSADFRAHASAYFLVPLLECHDSQQVELFCYSQVFHPDAITHRLQQRAQRWRSMVGLSDEQVVQQIREDRIDILVDLKVHTANNRLLIFARRPAPVQVTWLGYPGSTGLDTIDYRLSDPYLDPAGMDESVYSERTIRLPDTFWCYDPLDGRDVPINPLPALENGFVTFGCLNSFSKLNPGILALWAQVLVQVEGSRLLLLAKHGSHRQRTIDILSQEGIDPRRIEFVPHQPHRRYLELYQRIDLSLDCFPCNGHTTSLDSFWMGVPVVTLVGERAASRAGWSQLSNLGLANLAGHSPEQFARIAIELAADLPGLRELRSTLRQRMEQSPLMDAPRFARNVESAYRQMWRTWCEAVPSS